MYDIISLEGGEVDLNNFENNVMARYYMAKMAK